MAVGLDQFVKSLEDSGIISPSKLRAVREQIPSEKQQDLQELAKELIRQKKLTKYQAQEAYQGKATNLVLGNYVILDKIGAGGMGQVFKAQHRRMDRIVAVKMLPPAVTKDAAAVARFEREVKAAAKLRHPNIVAADDADQARGIHFLVMEYVEGSDLSALVKKNGPLPLAKALDCILQAAKGLEYAHKKGVVHRDIKPANLLLDKEGTVKILDMGLARIDTDGNAATQAELTGTGAVMGTIDYMAPEQARSTHHADARADIYSLGCSLHYLLTARPLYGGDTITNKLISHQFDPIPSLQEACNEVSSEVEALYEKMVAKKVEDRYQSMTEVIADLQPLVAGGSTIAGSATRVEETPASNSNLTFLSEAGAGQTAARRGAKPAKHPKAAQPRGNKNKQFALIGAGALGVVVLAAAIAIFFRSGSNTPVANTNQPAASAPTTANPPTPESTTAVTPLEPAATATPTEAAVPLATAEENPVYAGHQYRLVKRVVPWEQARQEAEALGGHLATITSAAQESFIRQQFGRSLSDYRGFWLGGVQDTPNAPWRWVNGESFDYTNWAPDEPNCRTKVDENTPPYYLNFFQAPVYPKKYGWNDTALGPSPRWKDQIIGYLIEWDHDHAITSLAVAPQSNGDLILNRDLTGWVGSPDAWKVENGQLVGSLPDKNMTFLYNTIKYQDFELSWEVQLRGSCNSGVQFRSEILSAADFQMMGPQAEIGGNGKTGYGGFWWQAGPRNGVIAAVAPAIFEKLVKPNDFNAMTLKCVDNHVTITLNGTATIDAEHTVPRSGYLGWQLVSHGGPVEARFRNIRLRILESAEKLDPDRRAAKWILSQGGNVRVIVRGGQNVVDAKLLAELPNETFTLGNVVLHRKSIPDSEFANLAGSRANYLDLDKCTLGDGAVAHLTSMKSLGSLNLSNTTIGDGAMATLAMIPGLARLNLEGTQVTDNAIPTLAKMDRLVQVTLTKTKVSPTGIATLRSALPNLKIE